MILCTCCSGKTEMLFRFPAVILMMVLHILPHMSPLGNQGILR